MGTERSSTSPTATTETDTADAIDRLLDLFVFAPIGLALEARSLTPELAERGRRQVEMARVLGAQAARLGAAKVDGPARQVLEALGIVPERTPARSSASAHEGASPASADDSQADIAEAPAPGTDVEKAAAPPEPQAPIAQTPDLAIEDYDSLAASQVVKRLDGLNATELEAVRRHEAATRGRRTILAKIARLQA